MVKRMLKVLSKEVGGLHEAAYLLAFFAILSQILALVRDRLLTYHFGAGTQLDLYYAAFKIPDIIFVFAASAVSISVLVPFLVERMEDSKEKTKEFVNSIFTCFSLAIIVISVVAWIVMPYIMPWFFKGFGVDKMHTLIMMSRILLLQPILLGVANFFGSIAQAHRQFMMYASGPILYNIGIIIGIILFYPIFGLYGLVLGVLLGALFHVAIQTPAVLEKGLLPRLTFPVIWHSVKKVWYLALPRTFTLGVGSLSILFLVAMASRMTEGSVAIFNLASNLQGVPLAIVGTSYSLAAFPVLAKFFVEGKKELFVSEIRIALQHIIFWSLPVIALFVVLRAQIVRVILGASTKFTWSNTRLTAAVLAIFALSVLAQAVIMLFTRAYYAAKETATPLIINSISAVLTIIFAYGALHIFRSSEWVRTTLASVFRVENVSGNEVLMLALGSAIASILNGIVLWILIEKKFSGFSGGALRTFWRALAGSVTMGAVSYIFLNIFDGVFSLDTVVGVFLQGFLAGIIGIASGIFVLWLLKSEELRDIWSTLHKKIWKAKVVLTDAEPR
ncbi:MAG: oligosaccharide flippase family protein [Candidatus Taylorbacteria bacterium]|nr:oligosaccharide flippase family protein [Candidatus Taylorbacteria bacterium]